MNDNNIVYSTDGGRVEPKDAPAIPPKGDGIVRIRRETKGRKGKGVITVSGLELPPAELKSLCSALKKTCGTGGSVKEHIIEIQGDNKDKIKALLEKRGFQVKFAGG